VKEVDVELGVGNKSLSPVVLDWQPIATAPFDRDLGLAVFDTAGGAHALVFPCRRLIQHWTQAKTKDVHPTHWRVWQEQH
jgi:hypothetical protein